MPSWYRTPNDEAAALARACARVGCKIHSLAIGPTEDGPHAVGQLECTDGWQAARLLLALTLEDAASPGGRRAAAELRAIAPGDDDFARLVHAWVKKRVRFVREKGEVFTGGGYTISVGYGDCDDHARLVGALAHAGGLPIELAFLHAGGEPKHVLALLGADGGWQWAETTIDARFGEHPLAAVDRLGIGQGRSDIAREVVIMAPKDLDNPPPNYVAHNPAAQVKLDSQALARLGFLAACDADNEDAAMPRFRRALLAFQMTAGITVDGLDGPQSRAAIAAALPPDEFGMGYRNAIDALHPPQGGIGSATPIKYTADLSPAFFRATWAMWLDFKSRGATMPPEAFLNVWTNESGIKASSHLPNNSPYFKYGYSGLNGMGTQERKAVGAPWDPVPVTPDSPGYLEWIGMSEEEQVPFVKTFTEMNVRSFGGGDFSKLTNAGALYLLNFLPAYFNHADDPTYVLAAKDGHNAQFYTPNVGLDVGGKGYIEVADMDRVMAKVRGQPRFLEAKARLYAEGGGQPGGTLPPIAMGLGPVLLVGAALGAAALAGWKHFT